MPAKLTARRDAIAGIAGIDATLVLFEAPGRLAECLADLAATMGDRRAVVARELTKLHEEMLRGSLLELAQQASGHTFKGEIVIVIAPPSRVTADITDDVITARLAVARTNASLRDAARSVADELGVSRKRVYELGLSRDRDQDEGEDRARDVT